jgi:hypothetical protein
MDDKFILPNKYFYDDINYIMSDCECAYPVLDCPCCCKEKAVLEGLIKRVSGYECYLRTFVVPASCQSIPWSAPTMPVGTIVTGGNASYNLGTLIVGETDTLSHIKVWPAIGCRCKFSGISQALFKLDNDCWGPMPVTNSTGFESVGQYLSGKYQSRTQTTNNFTSVVHDLLSHPAGSDADRNRFGVMKGAIEYLQEARRHYNSILTSLPC